MNTRCGLESKKQNNLRHFGSRRIGKLWITSALFVSLACIPSLTPSLSPFSPLSVSKAFAKTDKEEVKEQPDIDQVVAQSTLSGSFLAAVLALKNNDDVAAEKFLTRAHALDPDDSEVRDQLFLTLLSAGKIPEAVDLSKQIPKESKVNNMVTFVASIQAIRERAWGTAKTTLDELSGGDLDNLMVGFLQGWSAFGAGNPKEATKIGDSIDGPEWMEIVKNYQTGLMSAANGDDVEAVVRFQKVIDNRAAASVLTQIYLRAIEATVRAQTRIGSWEAANATLTTGYEIFPNHPPFAKLNAAIIKKESLAPLISNPQEGVGELFLNVGSAINRDDNSQFSRTYLQIANYLNGKDPMVILSIAEMLEKQKEYKLADEYYNKIDEGSDYFRRAQLESALNLNQMGNEQEAIKRLKSLVAAQPDDLAGSLTLGQLYSIEEDYRSAAEVYEGAVAELKKSEPFHWNLYYRRGIAYERLKEWDKAEPSFREALKLYPDQPDVLNYLGYSFIDMNTNIDEGIEMIKKAVELKPNSGYIIDSLGWAYYRQGKFEDAVKELERAVEIMPDDPTVNDHLGDAYWQVGRKLEAGFQWNHALNGKPELDDEERKKIEAKLENGLTAE